MIENLVLRQQLAVFKRQRRRPRLATMDKLFWVILRRFWSSWKQALIVVTPDTVVRWHRSGFQLYWRLISLVRKPVGRRRVIKEIRELIFRMVAENPTWRAPRIHGELVMLGYEISERSVSRWMRHAPRSPESAQSWLTFLRNHRESIAAMDSFSVPTRTFGVVVRKNSIRQESRLFVTLLHQLWAKFGPIGNPLILKDLGTSGVFTRHNDGPLKYLSFEARGRLCLTLPRPSVLTARDRTAH
jgi:hypothetical protein